jgi:hypothetical protein
LAAITLTPIKRTTWRLNAETHQRLRFIYAFTGETQSAFLERITQQALDRLRMPLRLREHAEKEKE